VDTDAIRECLLSYCAAFNRFDPVSVSAHYALPFLIATKDGQVAVRTPAESAANATALVEMYRNWGYSEARLLHADIQPLGERFASASAQWQVTRRGKLDPWQFKTHYTLSRVSGEWRIIQAVAFEDMRMHPPRSAPPAAS
jgi:ketosteroid isomerase-like protein